jgi:hypothetical protein
MDMEEDAEMIALLLKHMPSCIDAADIEQLVRDIPVQPPVVIPLRTVQEDVAAGDPPPTGCRCSQCLFTERTHPAGPCP